MFLNLAKPFCTCTSLILFCTTNATDRLFFQSKFISTFTSIPLTSINGSLKVELINSLFDTTESWTDFIDKSSQFTGKVWSAQTAKNISCSDHISKMRFHPKKYVKPTLSQQFLSKELKNLQPKTVIKKQILVFGFYLGSSYFAVNDILLLHSIFH